jgi:ribulose-bisphosphate carboxylase small chain
MRPTPSTSNRITQGTFSFLPDLTDQQIATQVQYCLDNRWAVSIEFTDDPHPRNTYWEMWEAPMFDLGSVGPFMSELKACRAAMPSSYVRVAAFDSTKGWESLRASFLVQRPPVETALRMDRQYGAGRSVTYSTHVNGSARSAGPHST